MNYYPSVTDWESLNEVDARFASWFAGLPSGKYPVSKIHNCFNESLIATGFSPVSPKRITMMMQKAGCKYGRDMVTRYLVKP